MAVRQQALATAQIYLKRYYLRVDIRHTNPYLVLSTAFYVACKIEECPQHIRLVVGEARQFWPENLSSDTSKLGECEFHLISAMQSQLVLHHPYRSLGELQIELRLSQEEMALAWSIVNDHYLTDLPLLMEPHVVAVTAAVLAVVLKPSQGIPQQGQGPSPAAMAAGLQRLASGNLGAAAGGGPAGGGQSRIQELIAWLAEGSVNIESMISCAQELISLYELWEQFNEKACKEQFQKIVKLRSMDR